MNPVSRWLQKRRVEREMADEMATHLAEKIDQLCEEGGRMMSVGLHGRIAGRPARARALARFLDHVLASGEAWVARRIDIAAHWQKVHPA